MIGISEMFGNDEQHGCRTASGLFICRRVHKADILTLSPHGILPE
jgi:hypothetical protein